MSTSGTGLAELAQTLAAVGGDLDVTRETDRFVVTATFPVAADPAVFGDEKQEDVGDGKPRSRSTRQARIRLVVATVAADRKSTRLNSSHVAISYAVFCLKKKKNRHNRGTGS